MVEPQTTENPYASPRNRDATSDGDDRRTVAALEKLAIVVFLVSIVQVFAVQGWFHHGIYEFVESFSLQGRLLDLHFRLPDFAMLLFTLTIVTIGLACPPNLRRVWSWVACVIVVVGDMAAIVLWAVYSVMMTQAVPPRAGGKGSIVCFSVCMIGLHLFRSERLARLLLKYRDCLLKERSMSR